MNIPNNVFSTDFYDNDNLLMCAHNDGYISFY